MESTLKPPSPFCFENDIASVTTGNLSRQWSKWRKAFETYSKACEIGKKTEDVQLSILLHVIGEQCREVYDQFTETFATTKALLDRFDKYFLPTKNLTMERHKFFMRNQLEGETTEQYTFELKRLAKTCEFGDLNDDLIKDRLICGLTEDALRERLLRECDLTLTKAMDISRIAEMSRAQANHIKPEKGVDSHIHEVTEQEGEERVCEVHFRRRTAPPGRRGPPAPPAVCRCGARAAASQSRARAAPPSSTASAIRGSSDGMSPSPRQNGQFSRKNNKKCDYCGRVHDRFKCPAYGQRCTRCNKANHFARMCRVYMVQENSTDQDSEAS
ncbi:uncharacterized protein LOC134791960 [Cydia splendana]|uniref:uncharacterized protein LOC134791960 n=1 Tax=Cydia splendana TaxID=1100963 RepID=UPI0021321D85